MVASPDTPALGSPSSPTSPLVGSSRFRRPGTALSYLPSFRSGGPLAVASKCRANGPGLETCIAKQKATFTIESFDAAGERMESGGEPFRVDLRGASVVRARVLDNEDGTYTVSCERSATPNTDAHTVPHTHTWSDPHTTRAIAIPPFARQTHTWPSAESVTHPHCTASHL